MKLKNTRYWVLRGRLWGRVKDSLQRRLLVQLQDRLDPSLRDQLWGTLLTQLDEDLP